MECTLRCCNVTEKEWQEFKHRRFSHIVRVKQLFAHIAYNERYDCKEIGYFLDLDRTTIIYNIKTLREEISIYPGIQDLVDRIVRMLGPEQMITYGWLARSFTGLLTISPHIPESLGGYWVAEGSRVLPSDQFPSVDYKTGPVKVKIEITLDKED